ncbi:MAG: O-acetyl-ADP-ribose deacetylase [Verrucomicrobiae bacterium]|nr:O-acetyl-ADP-ribose deacetylase [Verrucomicrobiae bacterium]
MKKSIGSATLEITQGDITTLVVDAIVNAANVNLQHGGGVAAAIVRKGGFVIQDESDAIIDRLGRPLETGEAVITTAGKLPAKFVIHTAGPMWGKQTEGESDQLLRRAVRNSLALAVKKKLNSIAFPAISTGIFAFPVERAAKLMLAEATAHLRDHSKPERVIFCLFDVATLQAFQQAFGPAD